MQCSGMLLHVRLAAQRSSKLEIGLVRIDTSGFDELAQGVIPLLQGQVALQCHVLISFFRRALEPRTFHRNSVVHRLRQRTF